MCRDTDQDILVIGYLSAVAGELDERGINVTTLRLGGEHPEPLSGTLALHPAFVRPGPLGRGPTDVSWREETGWSAALCAGPDGQPTARRHLHAGLVPTPATVAEFVAALVAGQVAGMPAPVPFGDRRHDGDHHVLTRLGRFGVPEPW